MGIRQKVAEQFGSSPNKEGKLGKQHSPDVKVTSQRSKHYHEELASSVFCGVMPGDGWSGRMEDSILQGCIPVIIQVLLVVSSISLSSFFFFKKNYSFLLFLQIFPYFRMVSTYLMKTSLTMKPLLYGYKKMIFQT